MSAPRPAATRARLRRSSSASIARAVVGWLEAAAPLAPGADHSAATDAGLACCGAAADARPAERHRRIDSWITK